MTKTHVDARSRDTDHEHRELDQVAPARLPRRLDRGVGAGEHAVTTVAGDAGRAIQLFAAAVNAGVHPPIVQLDRAGDADLGGVAAQQAAAHGLAGSAASLPHLGAIQRSFGRHDVSGVRAYVGGAAREASAMLGAHAYATGDAVAFAASPDLRLAAHEAAHTIQQRGGVQLADGLGRAGDEHEQHADAVADLVVRGESAEGLLDRYAGGGGGGGVQRQERERGGGARDAVVTAPSDPRALVAYARDVHRHLGEPAGSLVPYARALDAQLRAGAFDARATDVIAVVDALLAIRGALARRRPTELAQFRTTSSPLDGMIEDIAPFGLVDEWHALRAAARARPPRPARRAPEPPHEGGATTESAAPDAPTEAPTLRGGGETSARTAGREIVEEIDRPHDSTAGDLGTGLDAASLAWDTFSELFTVSEVLGSVALVVQPIIATISMVASMEDSWQSTQEGFRAHGMQYAVVALDGEFNPYPMDLRVSDLEPRIRGTDAYEYDRRTGSAYEAGEDGEREALLRRGIAQVCHAVNQAVHRAEAAPNMVRILAEVDPETRARMRQELRRRIYHMIVEEVRRRMAAPDARRRRPR